MFTLCYVDTHGKEHWDRFGSREALVKFLARHKLMEDQEVIIFPPSADDMILSPCTL